MQRKVLFFDIDNTILTRTNEIPESTFHAFEKLHEKICIGQGFRGKTGELGVGHCTRKFIHHLDGCPPTENQIYEFLKEYLKDL